MDQITVIYVICIFDGYISCMCPSLISCWFAFCFLTFYCIVYFFLFILFIVILNCHLAAVKNKFPLCRTNKGILILIYVCECAP